MGHFKGKVTVKALLVDYLNRVLVTLDGRWELPGGRLEDGESVAKAVSRELKEELGIEADFDRLVHSGTFNQERGGDPSLLLVVTVRWNPDQELLPSMEVKEHRWVTEEEAEVLDFYPNIRRALDDWAFGRDRPC